MEKKTKEQFLKQEAESFPESKSETKNEEKSFPGLEIDSCPRSLLE